MHRLCLILIVCLELMNEHGRVLSSNLAVAPGECHLFSLLSPDKVSKTTYSLSTSGWTEVSSAGRCALRTISKCPLSTGFLYEPVAGQCTPGQWLSQGSGGAVVPAGSADAQPGKLYVKNQTSELCPNGFKNTAVEYGSEGRFTCIVYLTTRRSYNSATSECNRLGGYLVSVRTAEKLQMVRAFAKGNWVWIGIDDQAYEGQFKWQEDGELWTSAEQTAVPHRNSLSPRNSHWRCVLYHYGYRMLFSYDCQSPYRALCESRPKSIVC